MKHSSKGVLRALALLALLTSPLLSALAQSQESQVYTALESREAYSQPISPLSEDELRDFMQGRTLVRQSWIIGPALDSEIQGLGPLYNRNSCIACHAKNGRGFAPTNEHESMRAMLVRLSIPGTALNGTPLPHPFYGDQLQEYGAPGVTAEGRASLSYSEHTVSLANGQTVSLRKPQLHFTELAYGPLPKNIQTSLRIAPAIYGMGLLQAIDEKTILALAAQAKPGKIKGRPNWVWDEEAKKTTLGRFGWKANVPSLRQQTASALSGDMGLSSSVFPHGNCATKQRDCQQAAQTDNSEISASQLQQMTLYQLALAVPRQRQAGDVMVMRGKQVFERAMCAACHQPTLKTGDFPGLSTLSQQQIAPYTDLLLHDMGPELADGRPDFQASASEWRTPPLWGIGLAKQVDEQVGFLHDGRARTLLEAILWHGGEAAAAREQVRTMAEEDRNALLLFLQSL